MRSDIRRVNRRAVTHGIAIALCSTAFCGMRAALAQEPLQAQLRLLTHNVFGKDDHYCDQRAKGFGHIVANAEPPYDVVGVTEYYSASDFDFFTCDSDFLLDAIRCTGRYTATATSRLFYPEAEVVKLGVDGGQGLFTTGTISDFFDWEWPAQYQQSFEALQGVIFCQVMVPNTPVTLDVYVVHLHSSDADDCDLACRTDELEDLVSVISFKSACSGNPVIVMGDFNVGGPPTCLGPEGYNQILVSLGSPRDLWFEAHPCGLQQCGNPFNPCDYPQPCTGTLAPQVHACLANPLTCGAEFCANVDPVPNDCNPGAPSWCPWAGYTWDGCLNNVIGGTDLERIDFIFVVTDPALSSSAFDVDLVDSKVVDFTAVIDPPPFVPCPGCDPIDYPPYVGNVSDHLGLEATVQVRGRLAVWVDHLASGPETGTSCDPFSTVAEGVAAVPTGQRVLIRSGTYAENLTINRAMALQAIGGVVRIGLE